MTLAMTLVAGCTGATDPGPSLGEPSADARAGTLLAIGDSILQWNVGTGESIPEVVGSSTGLAVTNEAVSGAWLTNDGVFPSIPDQRVDGDWEWLLVNGGANDLAQRCRCQACDGVLDEMVTPDGARGILPALVAEATGDGSKVVLLGYPEFPDGAQFGLDDCDDELVELASRLATLASATAAAWFVNAADVVRADDAEAFIADLVHPTPEGGRTIGEYVAETISANR